MRCKEPNRKKSPSQSRFRRLLARVLDLNEITIILEVVKAERKGEPYVAGKLGIAQSLIDRGWLRHNADGSLHLGDETRSLLMESQRQPGGRGNLVRS